MSRRLLIVFVVLGVLAIGGGVAGGLLLARDPGGDAAVAGPTTIPETTVTPTSEPPSSTSSTSTSSSTTSTTTGVSVQARVVQRLEDGVVVRYQASEPISAVLQWGFGGPSGNQLQFPGPAAEGSVKLVLARTTRTVSMRVTGQTPDGRTATSGTLRARRLVRRVVLEVQQLTLDIPDGTGGIATGFRGTTFTPSAPGSPGRRPAEPFAFPGRARRRGALGHAGPAVLPPGPAQPDPDPGGQPDRQLPRSGQSTQNRNVSAIGLTAHLRLQVTVTVS